MFAQCIAAPQFSALRFQQRCVLPCLGKKRESCQHLHSGISLPICLARKAARELTGKRCYGLYAPFVLDEQRAKLLSLLGRKRRQARLFFLRMARGQGEQQHGGGRQAAQRTAKHAAPRAQDEEERERKQRIARIRHGYAPRVCIDEERHAPMVGIEPPQQEARAVGAHDAVHQQDVLLCRIALNREFRPIVGRSRCAGVMLHAERRERDVERQRPCVRPLRYGAAHRFAEAKMKRAALGCEPREQCAEQYEEQGGVEQEYRHSAVEFSAHNHGERNRRRQRPQQHEPPRAVNEAMRLCRAPRLLQAGGSSQHKANDEKQQQADFLPRGGGLPYLCNQAFVTHIIIMAIP